LWSCQDQIIRIIDQGRPVDAARRDRLIEFSRAASLVWRRTTTSKAPYPPVFKTLQGTHPIGHTGIGMARTLVERLGADLRRHGLVILPLVTMAGQV
jgi:hypothetical protein